MKERLQLIARNVLLVFVFISIGFALGKEVALRSEQRPAEGVVPPAATGANKVVVYYLHSTFRCVTCNEIERLAKKLVETGFADELKSGRIEWREADFQKEEALAQRYGVVASCVVVAGIRDGKENNFQRLDEVWTKYQNPADFDEYVGAAIRRQLKEGGN